MPPETTNLANLYADFYRTQSDIERIAQQAGLDTGKIAIGNTTPATAWHAVIREAEDEDRMADMYAIVKKEHPRNKDLPVAWEAYLSPQPDYIRTLPPNRPPGNSPPLMSDNWRYDIRIDALQKEVADLRTLVAELRTTLTYLVSQNTKLEKQNTDILAVLEQQNKATKERADQATKQDELPHDISFYITVAVAIIISVTLIIYLGGNLP